MGAEKTPRSVPFGSVPRWSLATLVNTQTGSLLQTGLGYSDAFGGKRSETVFRESSPSASGNSFRGRLAGTLGKIYTSVIMTGCMLHAWYLPCDFHFFIVAVLVTSIIKKNKAVGVPLLYFITLLSVITPGLITYFYELNPTVEFQPEFLEKPRDDPTFQLLYVKSHTRISVYLLGMITAYHLFTNRKSTWKLSNTVSVLGCLFGMALLFAPMAYGGSTYYNPRRTYDVVQASIFASVRRLLWGLAWVVFLVINRFGVIPIFGKVFTWKISIPLSKITYAVYLIHFLLQISDQAKVRIPNQFIPFDMFMRGINDLFFSVGFAFVLYLFLELPFRLLFKELMFPAKKKRRTDAEKYPQRITSITDDPKLSCVKL